MKVIMKEPRKPAVVTEIQNDLKALQAAVGGYIETVTLVEDLVVICNEEGRLMGLPWNCTIRGVGFYGTILLVGINGDDFGDVPEENVKALFAGWFTEEGIT